jgi:hypothetical protein
MANNNGSTNDSPVDWDSFSAGPHHGDFARLIPQNDEARRSFQEVVQYLESNPDDLPHVRQLMHWEDRTAEHEEPSDASVTSCSTDDEQSGTPVSVSVAQSPRAQCGYYALNMDKPPLDRDRGHIMGSAHPDHPSKLQNGLIFF